MNCLVDDKEFLKKILTMKYGVGFVIYLWESLIVS